MNQRTSVISAVKNIHKLSCAFCTSSNKYQPFDGISFKPKSKQIIHPMFIKNTVFDPPSAVRFIHRKTGTHYNCEKESSRNGQIKSHKDLHPHTIKTDCSNLGAEGGKSNVGIHIENDPELKNILTEIRADFNDHIGVGLSQGVIADDKNNVKTEQISKDNLKAEIIDKDNDFSYYEVAEDIEEYDYKDESDIHDLNVKSERNIPISLERGETGVFDLDEFLLFLESLGAENVVTLEIPPEKNFCDHMVVASTKSMRHMKAIHADLFWVHKRKKSPSDQHLTISGVDDNFWSACDLGNIVLHLFYGEESREFYNIEGLWSGNPESDDTADVHSSKYDLSAEDLFWLEAEQLTKETKTSQTDSTSTDSKPKN